MTRKLYLLIALLFAMSILAQVPQMMSYQAVIRNTGGALVANAPIGMRVSILYGSVSGTVVYEETHTPTSNSNGLVSISIGGGTIVSGTFSSIDWENGPFFIKTETDPAGGTNYSITGTSQLLSVPYSLYSGNGGFSNFQVISISGNYVVPAGVKKIMIEVWGAGGGGAGTSTGGSVGGGGGGYGKGIFNVTPGATFSVTIGNGGGGGINATGASGGNSSFGTLITATGGNGGIYGGGHGAGGSASAPISINGGTGENGFGSPGTGGSAGGGGGEGGPGGGNNGNVPGGGGSGAGSGTGGSGADGRVIVWW